MSEYCLLLLALSYEYVRSIGSTPSEFSVIPVSAPEPSASCLVLLYGIDYPVGST